MSDRSNASAHPRHRRHGQPAMPSTSPPFQGVDARRRPSTSIPSASTTFAATHDIAAAFASLDEAIAWGEFDAVDQVTPDRVHHPTTHGAARGRQARLLREAAGAELCQGAAR